MKFSIIIPTYNRLEKLKKSLSSVFFQTFKDFEVIIIDNNSIDGTKDYIKSIKNKNIKFLKISNHGNIAKSRNYGIKNAEGEYIAFLDSDDEWINTKLEKSLAEIEKKNLDLFYHNMFIESSKLIKKKYIGFFRKLENNKLFDDLIENGPAFATSSVVVNKKIFQKINFFCEDDNLITWEDYDAWLRLSKITNKFGFLDEPLGKIYSGDENTLTEKNKIKNIFTFKEKYLKKESSKFLPEWCIFSLITSSFKLKKYSKVKEYYEAYILENNKVKKNIKIMIIFYISKLISFLR